MVIEDAINVGGNWDPAWEEKAVLMSLVDFRFVDLFDLRSTEEEAGSRSLTVMTVKSDACELGNRRVLVKEPDEDENSDVDIFVEVGIWIPVCIEDKNSLC